MFEAMPLPAKLYVSAGFDGRSPLDIRDGRRFIESLPTEKLACLTERKNTGVKPTPCENAVSLRDVYFRYTKDSEDVLEGLCLDIKRGIHTAVVGSNGTGKSTLLSIISGEYSPIYGKVKREKNLKFARLPQSPLLLFTENSVREDFATVCRDGNTVTRLCRELDTENLLDSHPADISGGELQRAAICKLLFTNPDVLLLDEPTKGMDFFAKARLGEMLRRLTEKGCTVVTVSHDIEFCAEYSDECTMLFRGKAVAGGEPHKFFAENFVYTTAKERLLYPR